MRIGVPKEIKTLEYRVGLVPAGARELVHHGHEVMIESGAGAGIGFEDADYAAAGAVIAKSAEEIYGAAEMVVKVKEPQPEEYRLLRPGQVLFAYLHLAADPAQAKGLLQSGVVGIAYETVTDAAGGLPLLAPMSEVAGRLAVQAGAHYLEKEQGGIGVLLGGVPGVPSGKVVVLGGGVVGSNALRVALGMGADVVVIDKNLRRLNELDLQYGPALNTVFATVDAVERHVLAADLVIGAVLVPGGAAPKLVSREMVRRMRRGTVIVDVAIDQGGCIETSRPTTHAVPTFVVDGVVHYCVTNMPAAVARTAADALTNATLPFVLALSERGYAGAMAANPHLLAGLNIHDGKVTHPAVAEALRESVAFDFLPAGEAIRAR